MSIQASLAVSKMRFPATEEARTVERYYIDPIRTLDVSAIALGEEENQDRIATREAELALNVLRNDEASAVSGPLLNEHNHEQNHGTRQIIPTTADPSGASKL
uniref:Uncharacterized protein B15I20.145 n=1 Tax=Neurospora crassa TaxID=5141 RepID=Q96U82_NEUCS|nr:hypothetical protein [Neurospora crassa]